MAPFGSTRRNGIAKKRKEANKNPDQTENNLLAKKARLDAEAAIIDAKLAAIAAKKNHFMPTTVQATRTQNGAEPIRKDFGDQRVVIKFFYEALGSPPKDAWAGRYGTIGQIRLRMGDCAPESRTVERTLIRLSEDDDDIAARAPQGHMASNMDADEDILVGLLACRGFSQTMALTLLNMERAECDPPREPVSLRTLRRAEARVQLIRRKRRSQKSGSTDIEDVWSTASLAQSIQLQGQFRAALLRGQAAAPASPTPATVFDGPTLTVGTVRTRTCATDPWGALGQVVAVQNSIWGKSWKGTSQMVVKGYTTDWKGAPSYFLDCVKAEYSGELYAFPPSDVYSLLSDAFTEALEAADDADVEEYDEQETDVGPHPPFSPEQGFWLDEHHEQCKLGKSSLHDCLLPRDEDGNVDLVHGKYGEWSDATRVKFPKEVRFLLGVSMARNAAGKLEGRRMEIPFEYTGKWVVGFKAYEKALRAEIYRVNEDLVGGGDWSLTRDYTKEELRALPGGRYQAWRIRMATGGDDEWRDNWREDVMAAVGTGSSACICIKELIDAAITEGNKLFMDTEYRNSWWLCHDHLSAWWEKEARDYIAARGFKDRQLRAWGSVNKGTRYHHSLVGNRPEMCPLDAHLFADLKEAVRKHVVMTCVLDKEDESRFKMGTPGELSATLIRTWTSHPEPYRIVQDISRIPATVDRIIEHHGGIVPDEELRHGRRAERGTRPFKPHHDCQAAVSRLRIELAAEVECARKG